HLLGAYARVSLSFRFSQNRGNRDDHTCDPQTPPTNDPKTSAGFALPEPRSGGSDCKTRPGNLRLCGFFTATTQPCANTHSIVTCIQSDCYTGPDSTTFPKC